MYNTNNIVVDYLSIVSALKNNFLEFVPNFLSGLIILVLGLFFAYIIKWLSQRLVHWLFLIVPPRIAKKSVVKTNLNSISVGTGRILFVLITFLSLTSSMDKMGFKVLSGWLQNLAKYAPNIVGAIFILFLGWNVKKLLSEFLQKAMGKVGITHAYIASETLSWAIFAISIFVSMNQIGIELDFLSTFISVLIAIPLSGVSLAFALGAKESITDILACHHVSKILSLDDCILIENKKGIIREIGPVFITFECESDIISISGNEFIKKMTIHKKGVRDGQGQI